jgi:hypothetical protein
LVNEGDNTTKYLGANTNAPEVHSTCIWNLVP